MALHGHFGASSSPELAKALTSPRLWDDEAETFAGNITELDYVLRIWAFHRDASADHHRWPGHTERTNPSRRRLQGTLTVVFSVPPAPTATGPLGSRFHPTDVLV